jgi:hypothetical protein
VVPLSHWRSLEGVTASSAACFVLIWFVSLCFAAFPLLPCFSLYPLFQLGM